MRCLHEAVAEKPLILVFYRGDWCPYCQIQMYQMSQVLGEIEAKGAGIWGISPQSRAQNRAFRQKRLIEYPILSDESLAVIRAWGLEDEVYPYHDHIPYPTTYVVGMGGRVVWRHLGFYDRRPTAGEIVAALPR